VKEIVLGDRLTVDDAFLTVCTVRVRFVLICLLSPVYLSKNHGVVFDGKNWDSTTWKNNKPYL
jgi:hypothetical protein